MRRSKAFSLVELMVAMMVLFLLGGAVITSFWVFVRSYETDRDYTEAREEIEYTFQRLGRDFTNISLGMPNNKVGSGDFSEAFRGVDDNRSPIMFFMGHKFARWGGPILLRWHPSDDPDYFNDNPGNPKVQEPVSYDSKNVYVGNELIYATAIPAMVEKGGVRSVIKMQPNVNIGRRVQGDTLTIPLLQGEEAIDALLAYRDEGRDAGIVLGRDNQRSPRSWIVLPGLQIPLLIEGWSKGNAVTGEAPEVGNALRAIIAPYSDPDGDIEHIGMLGGLEEVYLVKVARIFVNGSRQLVQEIYGDDFAETIGDMSRDSTLNFLAENIAGAVFIFDPEARTLTMHLAAMGTAADPAQGAARVQPAAWPVISSDSTVNDNITLPDDILDHRLVVGSRTWRIRN